MGKHFALTLRTKTNTVEKKQPVQKNSSETTMQVRIGASVLGVLVIALFFYLVQVNGFSTKGYQIRTIQNSIADLENNHTKLEMQAAQLESIQRTETNPTVLGMVPVSQVSFIQTHSLSER